MRYDTVVVGNGPAGCIAAQAASRKGDVALVGAGHRRVQCAGLISKSGFDRLSIKPGDFVVNAVRGAKLISPSGVCAKVDAKKTKAYVVDRLGFDSHLLDLSVDAGATFIEDWVTRVGDGVHLKNSGAIECDRTVVASGIDYSIHRGCALSEPGEFLVGGQYEVDVECDPDFVELHFNVPDFFSWVIPAGDVTRVGLCVKGNPRPRLDAFMKELKTQGRLKSDRRYSESFGVIPIHDPGLKTQFGDVVTVGDAAAQVKATTGGGIVLGGLCAKFAAEEDYESRWRNMVGSELRLHLLIHRFITRLSDRGRDRLISSVRDGCNKLTQSGDMDMASMTLKALAQDPAFMRKALVNLPWFAADMI